MKLIKILYVGLTIAIVGSLFSCKKDEITLIKRDTTPDGFIFDIYSNDSAVVIGSKDTSVTKITIPLTAGGVIVKAIADNAFENYASLDSVKLQSVTYIATRAFFGCKNTILIRITNPVAPILGYSPYHGVYENFPAGARIEVQEASMELYKNAPTWVEAGFSPNIVADKSINPDGFE